LQGYGLLRACLVHSIKAIFNEEQSGAQDEYSGAIKHILPRVKRITSDLVKILKVTEAEELRSVILGKRRILISFLSFQECIT
jgi:hypothetical protein